MATSNVAGNVAGKFGDASLSTAKSFANVLTDIGGARGQSETKNKETSIRMSVERIERDMKFLDEIVSERSQLSGFELSVLMSTVLVAFSSPLLFPLQVTSVLAPTCSAISAAVSVSAEYVGRVAVADGKEVAAVSMQAAAEAESLLSQSERTKAVLPLCVGVGATAATLSLLVPVLISDLGIKSLQTITEIQLVAPLIATLAAAVAGLSLEESKGLANRAINLGNRRFARSSDVGKSWRSASEQIVDSSSRLSRKWITFLTSTVPSPLIGALIPGGLATKAIIIASLSAAQSAFSLAQAEYFLARATDAVAIKARSAAVADTYANQGARSGAILPFTSALGGLCAAATAALVEFLPVASGVLPLGQAFTVVIFPTLGAIFAAAASVSKARCEVDAMAASEASTTLALAYADNGSPDGTVVLEPFRGVKDLVKLTNKSTKRRMSRIWKSVNRRVFRRAT
ncbi:hypothetical protein TrRE_jg3688 [Triparma retinervis]|uniref:Uncharacterized protein n=1 Tax=Triparma retinervis TaxID=2557542 RepID=A0A9W7ANX8_9STRA|nr:hypothetical protein TrRE_jg3688 [Triparma retinervis]